MKDKKWKIAGNESGFDRTKKEKKNNAKKIMNRLGGSGGGLSLAAFANAKSRNNNHNPAIIKKKREFYKNAKYVKKYKQQLKQKSEQNDLSSMVQPSKGQDEYRHSETMDAKNRKGSFSLEKLYSKKREEMDKERLEREAMIKAKKEEQEKAESRRKVRREKMYKKTRKGQPVMKYRIEHLLETIQGSK